MHARTLSRSAEIHGTGLFTGAPATLTILPTPVGSGITFRRDDNPHAGSIPAVIQSVALPGAGPLAKLPSRNTVLLSPPACFVATIEHVMSALVGMGIADATVAIRGPEVPILDGSAAEIVRDLLAGSTPAQAASTPITLAAPVSVSDGKGGTITATPRATPGTRFEYLLDYGPAFPTLTQSASWDSAPADATDVYAREIAPARTFCLLPEAQALRAAGLFAHVGPSEMLVIGPDGSPIENAFRFANEPARHKLLDLIGDVGLLGRPLQADIVSTRGGHALTHELCRAVLAAR